MSKEEQELPREVQRIHGLYRKLTGTSPRNVVIPEPPRGNSIRIYNARNPEPFMILGDPCPQWACVARQLDLTLNYWDKTPISDEVLVVVNTVPYLVEPEDVQYFESYFPDTVVVGPAIYEEDTHTGTTLAIMRERTRNLLPELKEADTND